MKVHLKPRLIAFILLAPAAAGVLCFLSVWGLVWHLDRHRPISEILPHAALRVGVDPAHPPFAFYAGDALVGLDIDLANALAEALGVPAQFVLLGYDGLYDALKIGQVDVLIAGIAIDSARSGLARYSAPYLNAGLALVSAESGGVESMHDLPGKRLALEFGSEADAEARRWLRRILPFTILPYAQPDHALNAVRLGAAEAVLVDAVTARLYLRDHPDWAHRLSYVTVLPIAIASHADQARLGSALDRALESLFRNGTIDRLLEKWL
jgi:polar amino acid transport system substrate-binding protein